MEMDFTHNGNGRRGQGTRVTTTLVERRHHVAQLYLRGMNQHEIAKVFGITQDSMSKDLRVVRDWWVSSAVRDFDAAKSQELAKIDEAEVAYWEGWEKSREMKQVKVTALTTGQRNIPMHKAQNMEEARSGDPRFLDGVLRCIERRCTLLGLDAPKRFQVDWDSLSFEQLERLALGESPSVVMSEG